MVEAMRAAFWRVQRRIEASCVRFGVAYPWWIPAYATVVCIAFGVIAFGQRGVGAASVLALVLVLAPIAIWTVSGYLLEPWIEAVVLGVAVCLFLTDPAPVDFAPLVLMISAAETAAVSRLLPSAAVTAGHVAILAVAAQVGHLDTVAVYIVCVVLGLDVGVILRWQMRAIHAERANVAAIGERAALAERQRLAREIHDVVGHALSITLLHVTAARHSLQRHGDIADAVETLGEAEQVGRSAMRDLRSTVDVLGAQGENAEPTAPLPDARDIPALVERSRSAGLEVRLAYAGDLPAVDASAGLGLYRIAQESLANIAKHAPAATAIVDLGIDPGGVRMSISNTLPAGPPRSTGTGRGLPGMSARAEQMGATLRAGVSGELWVVDVTVPVARSAADPVLAP